MLCKRSCKPKTRKTPTSPMKLPCWPKKIGQLDTMEQLLRSIMARHPDYHHAYNALGYSLADRGEQLPEARRLIEKALEYAPNDPFITDSLGWLTYREGNLPEPWPCSNTPTACATMSKSPPTWPKCCGSLATPHAPAACGAPPCSATQTTPCCAKLCSA